MPDTDSLLAEQRAYYRARAGEYDEWWQRQGRFDRGSEREAQWHEEVRDVERALDAFAPQGDVLELASGTGWWTERLARLAGRLTCVDASPEVMAVNRERLEAAGLSLPTYVEADLFAWHPTEHYDVVFFSFWLSHVPPERFDAFWAMVAQALKPGGRVFFIDNRLHPAATAQDQSPAETGGVEERKLNDGSAFRIVKLYYTPEALVDRLAGLGWRARCQQTDRFFIYGEAALA